MSTPALNPNLTPMFGPDGEVHLVPNDMADQAQRSGGEIAHQLKAPDGSIRYVRHSQLGDALRSGGVPVAAMQQIPLTATQSNASVGPQEQGIGASINRLKQRILDAASSGKGFSSPENAQNAVSTIGGVLGPGELTVAHGVTQLPSHPIAATNEIVRGAGQTAALPLAATTPEFLPSAVPAVVAQQGIQAGAQKLGVPKDYAELLGNVAGGVTGVKTLRMLQSAPPLLTSKVAAQTLTDAVNPNAAEMPKFQGSLQNQLPALLDHIKVNNLPVKSKADLAEAMQSAADTKKAQFQGKVDSVGDELVSTNGIPGYGGATKTYGSATIRQLYDRLTQVNSEMFNAYNKSSDRASGAAVKSTGELAAEAAALRNTLYSEMGKKLGSDPAQLADLNKSGGELNYLAEKTRLAADTERYMKNKQAQAPISVSPMTNKNFILDKMINGVRSNPANKKIGSVLQQALSANNALPPEE